MDCGDVHSNEFEPRIWKIDERRFYRNAHGPAY